MNERGWHLPGVSPVCERPLPLLLGTISLCLFQIVPFPNFAKKNFERCKALPTYVEAKIISPVLLHSRGNG